MHLAESALNFILENKHKRTGIGLPNDVLSLGGDLNRNLSFDALVQDRRHALILVARLLDHNHLGDGDAELAELGVSGEAMLHSSENPLAYLLR